MMLGGVFVLLGGILAVFKEISALSWKTLEGRSKLLLRTLPAVSAGILPIAGSTFFVLGLNSELISTSRYFTPGGSGSSILSLLGPGYYMALTLGSVILILFTIERREHLHLVWSSASLKRISRIGILLCGVLLLVSPFIPWMNLRYWSGLKGYTLTQNFYPFYQTVYENASGQTINGMYGMPLITMVGGVLVIVGGILAIITGFPSVIEKPLEGRTKVPVRISLPILGGVLPVIGSILFLLGMEMYFGYNSGLYHSLSWRLGTGFYMTLVLSSLILILFAVEGIISVHQVKNIA